MNNDAKHEEECELVSKKNDLKSKQADKQLIILKRECSDELSSENQSKCFVLGYN
ncbi:hypothetical protein [Colwellia psychrerythraea]|uniref:Uncharacterized protein n=1 Tax=Colwellia psychrerythraea TaxID=28229 RepID=A0A099KY29_COLPS|nr:hypothetical protein [Colwellia psychrerythraea]KGJ95085.1 hypothetical protein GAB14E_1867 [Colwellia psychrerythraea]